MAQSNKPRISIKIEGAVDLEKALLELPKRTGRRIIRKVLANAAEPIRDHAAREAEKTKRQLGQALQVSTRSNKRNRRSGSGPRGDITVFVGVTPGRLAHLIEFGSGPRTQYKTGRYTGRMPAFAFMRPAWEAGKRNALSIIRKDLEIEIEKAATRLAKRQAKGTAGS